MELLSTTTTAVYRMTAEEVAERFAIRPPMGLQGGHWTVSCRDLGTIDLTYRRDGYAESPGQRPGS